MLKLLKNKKGTTFIELLLYIAIFLVLTPILLSVSIYTIRFAKQHESEKQANMDSQFILKRVSDLVSSAKKIDVTNSVLNDSEGKLTLVMQDDSIVVIEGNLEDKSVDITEGGMKSKLSSADLQLESLYFERIVDELNDPEIIFSIATYMNVTGTEEHAVPQEYIITANLERGDFDDDGCPNIVDQYPRYPECCNDGDEDGICDENDNCVLIYNPFQDNFDEDDIGDNCDTSGPLAPFNCNTSQELLDMMDQQPPMSSSQLKQILMSSSPLSPAVLNGMIERQEDHNMMGEAHFKDVFANNAKLPPDVYQNFLDMDFPEPHRGLVVDAHNEAGSVAWQDQEQCIEVAYQVELSEDEDKIKFLGADIPLGDGVQKSDTFLVEATGGSGTVTINIDDGSGVETMVLSGEGSIETALGFQISLESIVGDSYAFIVSGISNTNDLQSVEFDFGEGAVVTYPIGPTYITNRQLDYFPGGCAENCGDVGTGVIIDLEGADQCYIKEAYSFGGGWWGGACNDGGDNDGDGLVDCDDPDCDFSPYCWFYDDPEDEFPEWCYLGETSVDDDTVGPAYMGGTQEGDETLYWEKRFETVLSQSQIDNLESITVAGEIAYQSTNQFFCDTLEADCSMSGNLVWYQDVELYNWETDSWSDIGTLGLDGSTSDQQVFEAVYDDYLPQRYVGGEDNNVINARIEFRWDGIPPEGSDSAPCFLLIDYLALHLKW